MNIDTQEELQTKLKTTINSHLKNYRISPTSGMPTVFTTSSQTTVFEIPGDNVFNPSRMSLNFTRGEIALLGSYYNCVPNFYIPYIERVELKSANGSILIDINNVATYSRLSSLLLNNYRENTQVSGMVYPGATVITEGGANKLHAVDPYLENRTSTNALAVVNDIGNDPGINLGTLNRAAQYDWSVVGTALPAKNINISLSDLISDSFFGINKEIYTSSNLYLRIQWAPFTSWLYRPRETFNNMSNAAPTSPIKFDNLNLNMYVEANPQISQIIKERYNSQQVLICPEIQSNNIVISNSAGYRSIIVKVLNSGDARLYKLVSGLASGNATDFYFNNNTSNYGNKKYDNVELYLNTLQLLNLSTVNNQDVEHTLQFYKNHSFSDLNSFKVVSPFTHVFDCSQIDNKLYDGLTLRGIPFDNPQGEHSLQLRYNIVAPVVPDPDTNLTVVPMNPNNQTTLSAFVYICLLKPIYIKGGQIQLIPFN